MTKITIISCIIAAVCVFQTAEAGLFDKQDLGYLMGNVQNGMSGALGNMKDMRDKLQNHGKEMIEDVKSKLEKLQQQRTFGPSKSSKACTNAYEEGQKSVQELMQTFDTCVMNVTDSHSVDVDNLMGAMNNMQADILKDFGDYLKCIQNPFKIMKCFTNMMNNVTKIGPQMQKIVDMMYELTKMFPNVNMCYGSSMHQMGNMFGKNFLNVGRCIQSVLTPF